MAEKYRKRGWMLLIVREIQVKSTVRYHLTLVRVDIIKESINNKCWRGCGEKGTLLHCWWELSWYSHYGEHWNLLKKLKNRTTIWPSNLTPEHISRENNTLKRYMYPRVHCTTVYSSQDIEANLNVLWHYYYYLSL